jgi:hypothetical protein
MERKERLRCGQWSTLLWRYKNKTLLPSLLLWLSPLSSPFLGGGGQHIHTHVYKSPASLLFSKMNWPLDLFLSENTLASIPADKNQGL